MDIYCIGVGQGVTTEILHVVSVGAVWPVMRLGVWAPYCLVFLDVELVVSWRKVDQLDFDL